MFWRKKDDDSGLKCPLCNSQVAEADIECPLCFYELDRSPRHQSLNITSDEEDLLIGLLAAENEPEIEDSVLEAKDVINLSAEDPIVQSSQDDDDEFISIPENQAPSFVSSRMVPMGVSEAEDAPLPEQVEEEEEGELDLAGISIPPPPESTDIEYEEITDIVEENDEMVLIDTEVSSDEVEVNVEPTDSQPALSPTSIEGDAERQLPLPPPPMPNLPPLDLPPPYIPPPPPPVLPSPEASNGNLTEGSMWPWAEDVPWDIRDLRRELLEAMAAAKVGQDSKARDILDKIGPHLGEHIDLLFHVGVLLKRLGREYELVQLLLKAQARHPGNQSVSNAASRLS